MKYRPEIDGLRALALVPVILFHSGISFFSGGFVGVDVFFVISGYLITTILIQDFEYKRFSFIDFYERRARRILPALFLVMIVCIPFAWLWMLPSQMKDFLQSLFAVSIFSSNILFWRQSGYFGQNSEEKPLLHTWSLGVEEQYYIFFPIFLLLAWGFGKNRVLLIIFVMASISFLLSEWGWRNASSANFYLSPTRAWEIFAGSIVAFVVHKNGVHKNNVLALFGLVAIVFSIYIYDESTPFPSVFTLIPVFGVVLLILYADKDTFAAKLLSSKPFVFVGLISYSAYLWHQPLFAFSRIRSPDHPSMYLMLVLTFLSLFLGYLSWRYIEMPFRNNRRINRATFFLTSFVLILCFSTIGLFGHFHYNELESEWVNRQTPKVQTLYRILNEKNPSQSNWGATSENIQEINACVFNVRELTEDVESRILNCKEKYGSGKLVLGDSHAIDLFGVIASRREHPFLIGVTQGGCRPHDNSKYCHYNRVLNFINSYPSTFNLVIYEQAGFYLLRQENGNSGSRKMFSKLSETDAVADIVVDEKRIRRTAEFLKNIAMVVRVNWFLPRAEPHISKKSILKRGCEFQYSYRPNLYETFETLDKYITKFVTLKNDSRLKVVSQNHMFRFDFPTDFLNCKAVYWSDGDHLSSSGEEYFGQRITPELFN